MKKRDFAAIGAAAFAAVWICAAYAGLGHTGDVPWVYPTSAAAMDAGRRAKSIRLCVACTGITEAHGEDEDEPKNEPVTVVVENGIEVRMAYAAEREEEVRDRAEPEAEEEKPEPVEERQEEPAGDTEKEDAVKQAGEALCRMAIPSAGIDVDVFPCTKWEAPDLYDVSVHCDGGYVGDLSQLLVCGHNTRTLGRLAYTQPGDVITLTAPDGAVFSYLVDVSKICRVTEDGCNLEDPDTGELYITVTRGGPALHLTVYTCCGDDAYRHVVRAIRI